MKRIIAVILSIVMLLTGCGQEQRAFNKFVPHDWYVVECLDIDGIVIWQDSKGAVYATTPNSEPKKIANSLFEYIKG